MKKFAFNHAKIIIQFARPIVQCLHLEHTPKQGKNRYPYFTVVPRLTSFHDLNQATVIRAHFLPPFLPYIFEPTK